MSKLSASYISLIVLILVVIVIIPNNVYAAEIDVKSSTFEETTIVEFTNNGKQDVKSFRIWLGSDNDFKSFKTESGWVGEKTPQGVIIFTSSESIKSGESLKLGVKTDKTNTGINWKALDKNDIQIEIGKNIPEKLTGVVVKETKEMEDAISSNSEFRIIPEKPSVGSTIRVTGNNFGSLQEFYFDINDNRIGTFQTDESGYFVTTMTIPKTLPADRTDFVVKDKAGNEKRLSLRIVEIEDRIPETENIELTIKGIPEVMHRGESILASGTAQPNGGVTITVNNSDDVVINTRTAVVDSKGNWKMEPVIVPGDAPFGTYTAVISDGTKEIKTSWTLETSKTVFLMPTTLKFNPGEIIKFNGTATPNRVLELVFEDPIGNEKYSDTFKVAESGIVKFEYPTKTNVDKEGTWTLITVQDGKREFSYVGLGELPSIPINAKFDKLNYKSTETATISLSGKSSDKISLTIIDPSDKPKIFSDKSDEILITLQQDGRKTYNLDLSGYSSGVYTAVFKKGSTKASEVFTVGLQAGSGEIKISTTKLEYRAGDPILILGNTNPNAFLTIELINPDGEIVKSIETFSDKTGKISFGDLRVPATAKLGTWSINAKSGANFDKIQIEVIAAKEDGLVVNVTQGIEIQGFGKSIDIKVINAVQKVEMKIIASNGDVIDTLSFPASNKGEIKQPWFIPKSTAPGTYTMIVTDVKNTAETTFIIK